MESGPILTSIIGASVATIGIALSKDGKVSEFRQQWIDALREDVAKLCSTSVVLYHGNVRFSMRDRMKLDVKYGATDNLVEEANNIKYRIRLRLDSSKERSTDLKIALDDLTGLCTYASKPFVDMEAAVEKVIAKTEVVLDEAWIHVRRGEKRFRWTYRFALGTLGTSVCVLIVHWYRGGHRL